MGLFQTINQQAREKRLDFLVIGGLAINFYTYPRDTADLDFLVAREARPQWLGVFAKLGYSVDQEHGSFIQLSPPAQEAWPVDLMLVQDTTFRPMLKSALAVEMFGDNVLIPSLEHLIALKLHALKHSHAGRFMKDFLDVENLVKTNQVDLRSENIRQASICMRKSPAPVESKDNQPPASDSVPELEFPIAPEFISRMPRVDPQAMLRRIEENLPWRNRQPGARERRLAQKIPEEFVL